MGAVLLLAGRLLAQADDFEEPNIAPKYPRRKMLEGLG
jgi:hypothetical protein